MLEEAHLAWGSAFFARASSLFFSVVSVPTMATSPTAPAATNSTPDAKDSNKKHVQAPSKRIFLFDVDGTLTVARKKVTPNMAEFLAALRKQVPLAIVGGSDLVKQIEQLGDG